MSGEMEAAGAAATAGLIAGAIEGREGRGGVQGQPCSNCNFPLNGKYCANCGQPAHLHRSLLHMFEEVLHGVIHFDTKFWRTLPKLVFRPGTLTREYVHGKRARYVSPLAIFLFTIFLMFFVFSFTGGPNIVPDLQTQADGAVQRAEDRLAAAQEARAQAVQGLAQAREDLQQARSNGDAQATAKAGAAVRRAVGRVAVEGGKVKAAQAALNAAQASRGQELQEAKTELAAAAKEAEGPLEAESLAFAEAVVDDALSSTPKGESGRQAGAAANEEVAPGVRGRSEVEPAAEQTWQEKWRAAVKRGDVKVNFGSAELNRKVLKKLENPDLILYKLQQTAYKFSFLLVPISLPFLALLFLWKRGLTLFDHTVFVLYSLSFVALLFIAVALMVMSPWDLEGLIASMVGLGLPAHMFFQLKGAYALGWWSALWRTAFLLMFASIAMSLFAAAIVVLGLVG